MSIGQRHTQDGPNLAEDLQSIGVRQDASDLALQINGINSDYTSTSGPAGAGLVLPGVTCMNMECRVVHPRFSGRVCYQRRYLCGMCHGSVFAACAVCFSLRAMFRVCHDFDSVFGFGFSFLCDSRLCGVVVDAMNSSFSVICQARG